MVDGSSRMMLCLNYSNSCWEHAFMFHDTVEEFRSHLRFNGDCSSRNHLVAKKMLTLSLKKFKAGIGRLRKSTHNYFIEKSYKENGKNMKQCWGNI